MSCFKGIFLRKGRDMQIDFLADNPAHIPVLASWLHGQWGHLRPGATLENRIEKLHSHLRRAVPLTLVAHEEGKPLGTASLIESDLSTRPDLKPWLASVFVPPEHRKRGVGAVLVRGIMEVCRGLGYGEFYLWTPDRAEFYRKLDWETMFVEEYLGQRVTVMRHTFAETGKK